MYEYIVTINVHINSMINVKRIISNRRRTKNWEGFFYDLRQFTSIPAASLRGGFDIGYWRRGLCVGGGMLSKTWSLYMGWNNSSGWEYFILLLSLCSKERW